jgi:uncharacterized protein YndB with AHSA1/START domain
MNRTVTHDTFIIERDYPVAPKLVFNAFADLDAKKQWFGDAASDPKSRHELDFRVGGRESLRAQAPDGGPVFTFDVLYQDIIDNERIVYSYEMTMDGQRISVSVATIEFLPEADGTHLIVTEQGAFLDGLDKSEMREQGTNELLDLLGAYLDKAHVA